MTKNAQLISDIFDRRAEQPLELDEEREAIRLAQGGDSSAQERLILAYAPALRNGVSWYTRALSASFDAPTDLEDIRQYALIGLLDAIKAFDFDKHERLAALAPAYIRREVTSGSDVATGFAVPDRTMNRFFGILRAAEGNIYEAARIAPEYEMKTETFLAVLSAVRDVDSYDAILSGPREEGEGSNDVATYPVWTGGQADVEDRILVEAAFRAVDTLESDIARLAYGFTEYEPVPDGEIAARLGMSRQKIQRTRSSALGKMRAALGVVA